MACPELITPNEGTSNQNTTKSVIEGHVSALKELLKEPSNRDLIKPMLLDFDDIQDSSDEEIQDDMKGKAKVGDEDLSKPFKEVLKCPFTRKIVEFSSPGHRMPANVKIYDGTGDPEDHVGRFMGIGNQGEWPMPVWCRMFQQTLDGKARAWFDKLPWGSIDNWGTSKRNFSIGLGCLRPVIKTQRKFQKSFVRPMKLSSFQRKCPELAKRFSDSIPKTVNGMLKRVDYLRSEEAFRSTELPRGEPEHKPIARTSERHAPYVPPHRPNQEFRWLRVVLTLDSLSSTPRKY
ncbi:hypothetical protein Tco_0883243 [Tanacetum coccineum]